MKRKTVPLPVAVNNFCYRHSRSSASATRLQSPKSGGTKIASGTSRRAFTSGTTSSRARPVILAPELWRQNIGESMESSRTTRRSPRSSRTSARSRNPRCGERSCPTMGSACPLRENKFKLLLTQCVNHRNSNCYE